MPTINDLRQQAVTIKNATQVGENTATRVGTTFETIADLLEGMGGVTNLSTIDIGSIDTLNTTGDMLVGTPNIYTLTKTIGANTFKVGTLFQFANNGRYDVAQVIVSQFIVDADGRIDTTSADQEVHIFYRLCKTMNGGSLPTPIGTWTTWTELGGSGGSGVTIDPYPTQNSGNAVSSGGVFERLQDIAPKVDISAIDDIDEYSDMLATKSPFYVVTKTLSGNVFRIGTLMEFANQGRYILYQILATDYVLNDDGTLDTTLSENGGLKLIWRMKQFSGNPPAGVTIGVWSAWAKFGDSGYQPDNEDIDLNASDQLQFANKLYDASAFSGLGRVYLRKNIVTLEGTGKNVLTQEMVNTTNTIYHIQYDYDLNGQTITLLAGCAIEFEGGSLTNGTIVGNGTLIVASSSVFRNVTLNGSYTNEYFDLAWFITSDSDLSLSNLVSSCNNCSKKMYIPEGTYTFTTPVVLNGTFDVQSVGTLNYNGIIDAAAITFGSEETVSLHRSVEIKLSQEYFPSNYTINSDNTATCPNNIGVLFYNTYNSYITILEVSNFCYGVKVASKNSGSCYNTFDLHEIRDCYQALTLMSEDGGWVNENLFLNGRLWTTRAFVLKNVSRGIVLDSTSNYLNNNNVFVKPCVEGLYIGLDFLFAIKNSAFGVRNEGNTINVRSNHTNNFVILYNNTGVNLSPGSVVISIPEINQYRLRNYLVFDSGVFTYAKDGNGNITLGNIGFADGSRYISSSVDDYGYIYGGKYYVDITRNEATDFIIQVDGSVRLSFNTYDANGDEITAEGDLTSSGGNIPFSSNTNGLLVGAAINSYYTFYVKNDNVKIVRVGIRKIGSTQFSLKRFSIYSIQNGSSVNTAEPSPALPSAPVESSGISFVSNTNTIAYTDNVLVGWELCNGNWVNKLIPRKYVYDFQRYVSDGTNYCIDGLLLRGRNESSTLTPNSTFSNYSGGFTIRNDAIYTPHIALKFFKLHGEREFWIKLDTLTPSEIGTSRPKIIIIGYDANMNQISIDNMTVTTETNVRYWEASGTTTHIKQENNHTIVVSQSGMLKFTLTGDIDSIALCAGVGIYKKMTLFANCMEPMTEMQLTLPNAPTAQGNSIAFGERVFDVVNHVPYYWDGAWRTIGGAAT